MDSVHQVRKLESELFRDITAQSSDAMLAVRDTLAPVAVAYLAVNERASDLARKQITHGSGGLKGLVREIRHDLATESRDQLGEQLVHLGLALEGPSGVELPRKEVLYAPEESSTDTIAILDTTPGKLAGFARKVITIANGE